MLLVRASYLIGILYPSLRSRVQTPVIPKHFFISECQDKNGGITNLIPNHATSIFAEQEIRENRWMVYPFSGEEASLSNCEEVRLPREMKLRQVTVKCQDCPPLQMGVQPISRGTSQQYSTI